MSSKRTVKNHRQFNSNLLFQLYVLPFLNVNSSQPQRHLSTSCFQFPSGPNSCPHINLPSSSQSPPASLGLSAVLLPLTCRPFLAQQVHVVLTALGFVFGDCKTPGARSSTGQGPQGGSGLAQPLGKNNYKCMLTACKFLQLEAVISKNH